MYSHLREWHVRWRNTDEALLSLSAGDCRFKESMGKKSTRDMSVEVNDLMPPVFADWLDTHDSYYRTEKGTVLHLTPFCSYAKGRALSRFHFCKKCLKTRRVESPKPQNDVDT